MKRLAGIASVALLALALTATSAGASLYRYFETPDGNIACVVYKGGKRFKGGIRCDVSQHTWVAPPRPKRCEFDYGAGATLAEKGRGRYSCVSDSLNGLGKPLAPGVAAKKGPFTCKVETVPATTSFAVRCVNRRNQHGFSVSPQAIGFF
jgi:hypothetical protein